MRIYTELLKILVTFLILQYFWKDQVDITFLGLIAFLVVYAGNIIAQLCQNKINEMFADQKAEKKVEGKETVAKPTLKVGEVEKTQSDFKQPNNNVTGKSSYEFQRQTVDDVTNMEQKQAITEQVFIEYPGSPLLRQDPTMSYVEQIDVSKAGDLDKLGWESVFNLSCNNTYSAGSRGWMCISPKNQFDLDTRGRNRCGNDVCVPVDYV